MNAPVKVTADMRRVLEVMASDGCVGFWMVDDLAAADDCVGEELAFDGPCPRGRCYTITDAGIAALAGAP